MGYKSDNADINRLRFVFGDSVVSLGFPAGATLEDVAWSLDTVVIHHDEIPIAIDVTLAVP
jgi:hypothetical protein